jgi:predicted transglutaminase-like cysteine proteinase
MLLLSTLLLSSSYPNFTQTELAKIKKKNGEISQNRVIDYKKNIERIQSYSKEKQLRSVNFYLNQLLPQYDDIINKKEDHWSTPKEFLITGYGDCEDYVIIKYFTLIKLGFDEKKLFLNIVKENYRGGYHMVLSYFKSKGEAPLVLDNLSFKILNLDKRKDLKADVFINSTGVYRLKNNKLVKIANHSREYLQLLQNIQKEN